ncbi:hypothetical protein DRN76_02355 [Methanosarcinales archaeon]|nr:MAG: hypothetical protein DRN76_02355 [Methanosarcinales archaeon]
MGGVRPGKVTRRTGEKCPICGREMVQTVSWGTVFSVEVIDDENDDEFFGRKRRVKKESISKAYCPVHGTMQRIRIKQEAEKLPKGEKERIEILRKIGVSEKNLQYMLSHFDEKREYIVQELKRVEEGWEK